PGAPQTGLAVQMAAAATFVPVTLELGGKSPQLVFSDADIEAALPVLLNAIIQNAGQTCSAGSRVLIQRAVYSDVMGRLAELFQATRTGAASDDPDCGPLINARQLARVKEYLHEADEAGISIVARGQLDANAPSGGYFQV